MLEKNGETQSVRKHFFSSFCKEKGENAQQATATTRLKPINTQQLLRKFTQHKFQQLIFEALIFTQFVYLTELNWERFLFIFVVYFCYSFSQQRFHGDTRSAPQIVSPGLYLRSRVLDMFVCHFVLAHTHTHTRY